MGIDYQTLVQKNFDVICVCLGEKIRFAIHFEEGHNFSKGEIESFLWLKLQPRKTIVEYLQQYGYHFYCPIFAGEE
tara:strand:+ start:515 stop:742 length:228 start_codon:yes stop_codon:yes gene_type:complete